MLPERAGRARDRPVSGGCVRVVEIQHRVARIGGLHYTRMRLGPANIPSPQIVSPPIHQLERCRLAVLPHGQKRYAVSLAPRLPRQHFADAVALSCGEVPRGSQHVNVNRQQTSCGRCPQIAGIRQPSCEARCRRPQRLAPRRSNLIPGYSKRSATSGSIRVARCAGMMHASKATASSSAVMAI